MPTGRALHIRRFVRAGEQRLKEARFLLDHDFTTASVYLAGYAVECALKVLILSRERPKGHAEVVASFRGSMAHDFNWLKAELRKRAVALTRDIADRLSRVNLWSTGLRYDPTVIRGRVAHSFIVDAEELTAWVRKSL